MSEKRSTIISLSHISKQYNKKPVLSDVNLSVAEGEIFGLIGPSGAGKTTLIKILTGEVKQSAGTAFVCQQSTQQLNDTLYTSMGTVFDNLGLFERLTCYQNLLVFSEIYKCDKKRIMDVLRLVGLEEHWMKKAYQLSKGMRQRLAIARAVLHRPKILLLDEPTSGLDPINTEEIHNLIKKQVEEGTTVFLTTHRMDEAMKLCDTIALLNEGTIIEYDTPYNICHKYNIKQQIDLILHDGSELSYANDASSAEDIYKLLQGEMIKSIHSTEPSLEAVFLQVARKRDVV